MHSNRLKSSQIDSNRVKSSQMESNRVKSSQIESNRLKSSQIESNRVKSSQIDSVAKMSKSTKIDGNHQDIVGGGNWDYFFGILGNYDEKKFFRF